MQIFLRLTLLLGTFMLLAACVAAGQAAEEQSTSPKMPAQVSSQAAKNPALASSALLMVHNQENHRYEIRFVEPATGEAVPGSIPISLGRSTYVVPNSLSPDGGKLAAIESHGQSCEGAGGGTACRGSASVLRLVDLHTYQQVTATLPVNWTGWAGPLAFTPDTAHVAVAQNKYTASILTVYHTETGERVAHRAMPFRPSFLAPALNGTAFLVYGQPYEPNPGPEKPQSPQILLLHATTLDVIWEETLHEITSGHWCLECSEPHGQQVFTEQYPAVVSDHEGRRLYIVHADEARLTTLDLDAQTVRTVEIQETQTWIERLLALTARVAKAKGYVDGTSKVGALGPDGRHLYIAMYQMTILRDEDGQREGMESRYNLQIIDVEAGRLIASRNLEMAGPGISPEPLWFTPDGAFLVLTGVRSVVGESGTYSSAEWTEVLDAKSLEPVTELAWRVTLSRRVDGQPIMVASRWSDRARGTIELALVDAQSFETLVPKHLSWTAESYAAWVTP